MDYKQIDLIVENLEKKHMMNSSGESREILSVAQAYRILRIKSNDMNIIQPSEIEKVMIEKLTERKINDEFGWTGEWRMSAKNVLDILIDLTRNA